MGMDGARPAPASCISSRISARLPTYDPCTVRLRSGQSGSDARSSPPKSPTTTSRPRVAMTPSPRAALLSDPTKSMAAAAPPPVARRMRLARVRGAGVDDLGPRLGPRLEGRVVDVGDDDGGAGQRLREPQGREADAAETDDDERAPVDPRPDLPHRAEGGEPRAGVGAGEGHRQLADIEEITGMRDEDVIAEPAGPGDPERPRLRTQVLLPRFADAAAAAADPGVGHVARPHVDALGVRAPDGGDAGDLVPQRQRQRPSLRQVQPPAAPHVEESVLQVKVAVAHAAGLRP